MKPPFLFLVILLVATSAHAQKSTFKCLSGNCKNGEGVQSETIRYPKSAISSRDGRKVDTYRYFIHIAPFQNGQKQGVGLRLEFINPHPGCYQELMALTGEKDPEKIPYCSDLKTAEQVTYRDDQVAAGLVKTLPYIDKTNHREGWYAYEREEDFIYANHFIDTYEVPVSIVLYKRLSFQPYTFYTYNKSYTKKKQNKGVRTHYTVDSIFIRFNDGYYAEKHKDEGTYFERFKDSTLQVSFQGKGSKWLISNRHSKDSFVREIFFTEKDIRYSWNPCDLFTFPADQAHYAEIQINDSTFYKGGTKGSRPHGFGILTRTLDTAREYPYSYSSDSSGRKTFIHKEIVYTGYFVDGKRSCVGLETRRVVTYRYDENGTRIPVENIPEYTVFGSYENDHLVYGKTLFYKDREDIVYEGSYRATGGIYPYWGARYKRDIPSAYNRFQLIKTDEGFFDHDGTLISGTVYHPDGTYTQVAKSGNSKTMTKAKNLYLEDVVRYEGVERMVLKTDLNGNVYFTDGTFVSGETEVEILPPEKKDAFMCTCSVCDGQGYIVTNTPYVEKSTYYKQETDHVDYLGYKLVKTYRVTESNTRIATSRHYCANCSGRGKIICR